MEASLTQLIGQSSPKVKKGMVLDRRGIEMPGPSPTAPALRPTESAGSPGLYRSLAEISGLAPGDIIPGQGLEFDLNLDSIKRVELLCVIEQELGVYLDESLVGPETTVAELSQLVEQRDDPRPLGSYSPYRWPLSSWCVFLREGIHRTLLSPWLSTKYCAQVSGLENLKQVEGPMLVALNHNAIKWDSLVALKVLPSYLRRRMAFASAVEITFGKRWLGVLASLAANAFPLSRDDAIRASLEHVGSLLEEGWSVGIFPEGQQKLGASVLPFKSGIGLLAVESQTPVLPIHLVNQGTRRGCMFGYPRREAVAVRIGRPLTFSPGESYLETTRKIEEAVRAL